MKPAVAFPENPFTRPSQGIGEFEPGDPTSGYYNDLTVELARFGPAAADARAAFDRMTRERSVANPIDVAQLGLGALQAAATSRDWLPLAQSAATWIASDLDENGRLAFRFAMPHTFELAPPWYSAMAQGQAASLLVRAAAAFGDRSLADCAGRTCASLTEARFGLITTTPEGPVLQEYPITPPPHVLNGWIFALWGLYDVSRLESVDTDVREVASAAFDQGVRALCRRLPLYELGSGWSRYDLYPHPIVHVASPFYHRLHTAQLAATARLRPDLAELASTAERWAAATRNPFTVTSAFVRKVAHRLLVPTKPRK